MLFVAKLILINSLVGQCWSQSLLQIEMPDIKYRSISKLSELKPGDHICVQGSKGKGSFASYSTSTSYGTSESSSSSSSDDSKRTAAYTHHLMVVRVINNRTIEVIHKTKDPDERGRYVHQDKKRYRPEEITVLDYESKYTGDRAVQQAQGLSAYKKYNLLTSNSEHFVFKARTGEKQREQIGDTAKGGMVGRGAGALAGGGAGVGIGALVGGALGSVVPGPGTFTGAAIGSVIGGVLGAVVGTGGAAGGGFAGLKLSNKKTL